VILNSDKSTIEKYPQYAALPTIVMSCIDIGEKLLYPAA